MGWYVMSGTETIGPVSAELIGEYLKSGKLGASTFVRDENGGAWMAVAQSPFAPMLRRPRSTDISTVKTVSVAVILVAGLVSIVILAAAPRDYRTPTLETAAPEQAAAAVVAAPVEESPDVIGAPFVAKVDANWATFDALPKPQQTKDRFRATLGEQNTLIDQVPENARPLVADHMLKLARQHISSWYSFGTSSAGDDATDLVPSANKAACQMWGSMWVHDIDTLSAIMTMGFRRIVCSTKTWILKDEASACYLWSIDPDDKSKGTAIVWSTLELYQRSLVIGKRTDDDGMLAYMGLMENDGASTMVPGVKAEILDSGPGWFHVKGANFLGYVPADLCHHTSAK